MFAAIYIPDFPFEAVVRARPESRDHAIVVLEGTPPLSYVVALNDRARELGLRIGMTRMQAEVFVTGLEPKKSPPRESRTSSQKKKDEGDPRFKLVRDPIHMHNAQENAWLPRPKRAKHTANDVKLSLVQRSPQQETAAHAALLDCAYSFSPRVEDTAADTVLLDLDGLDRLFGSPQKIAREIARRATELGVESNVAVAANPDNAVHAARGFTGVTLIHPGHEAERLGTLSLTVLFAAELNRPAPARRRAEAREREKRFAQMHETLERWGIRNFRALGALPPVSLSERLGAEGVRLQKLANGETTRELLLAESALEFHEALELDYPVELIEPLGFLLGRMLEQLCARLTARALSTNELHLKFQLEHRAGDETTVGTDELDVAKKFVERKLTLPVAMNDARLFLKLLHLELNGNPPGGPVIKIWLSAEPSRPRVAQAGLFVPLAPEAEKLELTLARIQRVLGAAPSASDGKAELRAGSPELLDTHQPDAFRMKRFQPRDPEAKASKPNTSARNPMTNDKRPTTALPTTAFRTLRPALAAQVWLREGRPVRLACDPIGAGRSTENVLWAAGPWRTSGNWWVFPEGTPVPETSAAPQVWHREQWDVALASANLNSTTNRNETQVALYRVSHDLLSQEWFVEGSYD
jgi:protein ImuB